MTDQPLLPRHGLATGLLAVLAPALAAAAPAPADYTKLELEQLMAMEVSGITGRAGSYAQSPAAVWVISGDDIRRSGLRSLADVLRLAPGVQVLRRNAQNYTVTARGFGGDKLQVLVDGRSVYSPLQSEVFWDTLDTYLEDVARIEVIRGPGATIWGANAVNGVINIVTRPAGDSHGLHLHGGAGTEERAFGGFRAGAAVSDWGHGRLYAQGRERDAGARPDGSTFPDGMSQVQAGARLDGALGEQGSVSLFGDVYSSEFDSALVSTLPPSRGNADGRNIGVRWSQDQQGGGETVASLFYDGYDRMIPQVYEESRDTWDLGVQQNFAPAGRHRLTGGIGARVSRDRTGGAPLFLVFDPASSTRSVYSAFLQDEITLADWTVMFGSKVERNDYTGFEFQPSARVGWNVAPETFAWASVSRATRTPNRLDNDIVLVCAADDNPIEQCDAAGPIRFGNPDFASERLVAYETGLRQQLGPTLLADVAAFYNRYQGLRSTEATLRLDNKLDAESYGGELTVTWDPLPAVRLQAFYAHLRVNAWRNDHSADPNGGAYALEGGAIRHRAGVRASWQVMPRVSIDGFLRYMDQIPERAVPSYTALNLRVGWQVTPLLEVALAGQNLTDPRHPEFVPNDPLTGRPAPALASEVQRNLMATFTWRWQ